MITKIIKNDIIFQVGEKIKLNGKLYNPLFECTEVKCISKCGDGRYKVSFSEGEPLFINMPDFVLGRQNPC